MKWHQIVARRFDPRAWMITRELTNMAGSRVSPITATASSRDIFGCSKNRQNRIVENSTYPLDDFGFR
jgi:hypothetical protein